LAFHVAEVVQNLPEGLKEGAARGRGTKPEDPYPGRPRLRLRSGCQQCQEEPKDNGDDEPESSTSHSSVLEKPRKDRARRGLGRECRAIERWGVRQFTVTRPVHQ